MDLLNRIIRAYRGELGIGLPIGSLTSQHFANFYLGWLDRFVKETLRVRRYVRYMDDMILWNASRERLVCVRGCCKDFAATFLGLEFKPSDLKRTDTGVPFLGCRIWPTHVELSRRSKRRWRQRVRVLELSRCRLGFLSETASPATCRRASRVFKGGRREKLDISPRCVTRQWGGRSQEARTA